jgi:hypothetical protein
MRQVFLVHGINSDGDWQKDVGQVLEPHFEVVHIRYWQYRWLGAVKLVFEPWALIVAGGATYFLASRFMPAWLAVALGVLVESLRLSHGPDSTANDDEAICSKGRQEPWNHAASIIAHSFDVSRRIGLKNFRWGKGAKNVLVGCVFAKISIGLIFTLQDTGVRCNKK